MDQDLSRCLHAVTARADRAADGILRTESGISYKRFLALYAIREEGTATQRAVADRLGVTEPSTSRMMKVLVAEGLVSVEGGPVRGNRRHLRLTSAGAEVVDTCGELLERRFAELVQAAGVPYRRYRDDTARLLAALSGSTSSKGSTVAMASTSGHPSKGGMS